MPTSLKVPTENSFENREPKPSKIVKRLKKIMVKKKQWDRQYIVENNLGTMKN